VQIGCPCAKKKGADSQTRNQHYGYNYKKYSKGDAMAQKSTPKRGLGGCLRIVGVLFVLLFVCGLGFNFWQNQLFDDFHAKYLAGDCAGIDEVYEQLSIVDEAKEKQVQYEYTGCQMLNAAQSDAQGGDYYMAFINYMSLIRDYADTTLATMSGEQITALTSDPAPITADVDFCSNLNVFELPDTPQDLQDFVAENWFSCAETLRDADSGLGSCEGCSASDQAAVHYSELIGYIETYAEQYPLAGQEGAIDDLMVDVMTRQAEVVGAGEISLPPGRSFGGSDAVLIIQNAAPLALRVALTSGETSSSTVESVAVCEDCVEYTGSGPAECPESEFISTIRVPAGTYSVIVNTTGGGVVTPYVGTWDLEAGTEYFQCFFIVSN
jgi:hypothetical protein